VAIFGTLVKEGIFCLFDVSTDTLIACFMIEKLIQIIRSLLSLFTGPNFKPMKQERGRVFSNMLLRSAFSSTLNMEEVYSSERSENLPYTLGRAIAQAVSRRLSTARPEFQPRSGYVGFVVGKVALGQVFSRVFRFLLPIFVPPTASHSSSSSITQGWYNKPFSGRPTSRN
jgi:hypothetical protein